MPRHVSRHSARHKHIRVLTPLPVGAPLPAATDRQCHKSHTPNPERMYQPRCQGLETEAYIQKVRLGPRRLRQSLEHISGLQIQFVECIRNPKRSAVPHARFLSPERMHWAIPGASSPLLRKRCIAPRPPTGSTPALRQTRRSPSSRPAARQLHRPAAGARGSGGGARLSAHCLLQQQSGCIYLPRPPRRLRGCAGKVTRPKSCTPPLSGLLRHPE